MLIKVVLKTLFNILLGGIIIGIINLVGGLIGFHIAMNAVSAFVAGTLGIPGVALLIIIKYI